MPRHKRVKATLATQPVHLNGELRESELETIRELYAEELHELEQVQQDAAEDAEHYAYRHEGAIADNGE